MEPLQEVEEWMINIYSALVVVALVAIALGFIFTRLFTGPVTEQRIRAMMQFCYAFTLFSVVFPFLALMFFGTKQVQDPLSRSPIGMVRGCVEASPRGVVPQELDCQNVKSQWVVNIGGVVLDAYRTDSAAEPAGAQGPDPGKQKPVQTPVIHGGLVVPVYVVTLALLGGAISLMRRLPEIQSRYWHAMADKGTKPADRTVPAGSSDVPTSSEDVGVSGGAARSSRSEEPDRGGVSEQPDSVVTGESRVQTPGSTLEEAEPLAASTMPGLEARQRLVFQIMQVISAPLIAMTAYYVFSPASQATSVIVGFVSGFASESILVSIRNLADRLKVSASGTGVLPKTKAEE